jgi:hypothetical protein
MLGRLRPEKTPRFGIVIDVIHPDAKDTATVIGQWGQELTFRQPVPAPRLDEHTGVRTGALGECLEPRLGDFHDRAVTDEADSRLGFRLSSESRYPHSTPPL